MKGKKKALFPILALVLALALAVPILSPTPALAADTTYDFSTLTIKPHYAYDEDVNSMGTGGPSVDSSEEPSGTEYYALGASDDSRWQSLDPGRYDYVFLRFEMIIAETPGDITNIELWFEGYGETTGTFEIWADDTTNGWVQIGSSEEVTTGADETVPRSITSNCAYYINGSGVLTWGVFFNETTTTMMTNGYYVMTDYVKAVVTTPGSTTYDFFCFSSAHDDDVFSMDTGGPSIDDSSEASAAEYVAISASDDSRWQTQDPGSGDTLFVDMMMVIAETPGDITNIELWFEGYGDDDGNYQIWAYNNNTSLWDTIGTSEEIIGDTEETFHRSISSNCAYYINGCGLLRWGVHFDNTSECAWVDYVAAVVTVPAPPPEGDYGDAPEGGVAYPPAATVGQFPTCITPGPASFIYHAQPEGITYFGPTPIPSEYDIEPDGNAGLCPPPGPCFPPYDMDECFMDGDAGLLFPEPYTIVGPAGSESITTCPNSAGTPLGVTCQMAQWGLNVDIIIDNLAGPPALVNVLMDWDQNGAWDGLSTVCPPAGTPVPEHVLVNFPVPSGFIGPLSVLGPPGFQIGPNDGYVWTRFTISELPVEPDLWDGSGIFEFGETEDYLLRVDAGPGINIDKYADEASVEAGQTIHYHYDVTNDTGLGSITGVSVTDDTCTSPVREADNPGNDDATLEDGETWTYTCDYVTTMADLSAGQVDNKATASGTGPGPTPVEDKDTETVTVTSPTPAANPALPPSCGLDVVLALDMSGSIETSGAEDTVKDAAKAFVDALLPATPSLIGLVEFSVGTATVVQDLTADEVDLNSDIGLLSATPSGYTNWEKALLLATGLLETGQDRDDTEHPDLIIIITNGEPTTSDSGWGGTTDPSHLQAAIIAANAAKTSTSSLPIRILAVGIDPPDTDNLEAISGSNIADDYGEVSADTDVVTGVLPPADPDILDLAGEMADVLKDLADECFGTIIVEKVTDPTPDPTDTSFGFTAGGGLSPSSFSLKNGEQQDFTDVPIGLYNVTETVPDCWELGVVCTGGDCTPITDGVTVDLDPGEEITCTFTNTKLELEMTIDMDVDPHDVVPGGQVEYTIEVINHGPCSATNVSISATLPAPWFTYASTGTIIEVDASRPSTDPSPGTTTPTWGEWLIQSGGSVTIPFTVDVDANIPSGTYDTTAYASGDNFDPIDDVGDEGQDADTPPGEDPEEDEDVTVEIVVGGEVYPVNKMAILAPWIVLAVLLAGGISWLTLRRWRTQS